MILLTLVRRNPACERRHPFVVSATTDRGFNSMSLYILLSGLLEELSRLRLLTTKPSQLSPMVENLYPIGLMVPNILTLFVQLSQLFSFLFLFFLFFFWPFEPYRMIMSVPNALQVPIVCSSPFAAFTFFYNFLHQCTRRIRVWQLVLRSPSPIRYVVQIFNSHFF